MNQSVFQSDKFTLRCVSVQDEQTLFEWANDPVTRKNSFNSEPISWDTHQRWFKEKLNSPDTYIWMFECQNISCGWVRIEKMEKIFKLSCLIATPYRGQKLGSLMLKMALSNICTMLPGVTLVAYTVPGNIASCKVLQRAGFVLTSEDDKKISFVYKCT